MKSPILNFTQDQRLKVGEELAEQYKNAPFGKNQLPRPLPAELPSGFFTGKDGRPFNYQGPVDPGFYTDLRPLPMPFPGVDRINPPIRIGGPVLPRPLPMPIAGELPAPVAPPQQPIYATPPVGGRPKFGNINRVIKR